MVTDYRKEHWRGATFTLGATTLDVLGWEVTEEIAWTPTIQAQVRVALPVPLVEDVFDARAIRIGTLTLQAGQAVGVPDPDSSATFRLVLRRADLDITAGTANLYLESTDVVTLGSPWAVGSFTATATTVSVANSVRATLAHSSLGVTVGGASVAIGAAMTWEKGRSGASLLEDVQNRTNTVLLANRDGSWTWHQRSALESILTPIGSMTTYPEDTLSLRSQYALDAYYNAAQINYSGGITEARYESGEHAYTTRGLRVRFVDRSYMAHPGTSGTAGNLLRGVAGQGRTYELETIAHYPLRAAWWIAFNAHGLAGWRRVESVRFTDDGRMTLQLQSPIPS